MATPTNKEIFDYLEDKYGYDEKIAYKLTEAVDILGKDISKNVFPLFVLTTNMLIAFSITMPEIFAIPGLLVVMFFAYKTSRVLLGGASYDKFEKRFNKLGPACRILDVNDINYFGVGWVWQVITVVNFVMLWRAVGVSGDNIQAVTLVFYSATFVAKVLEFFHLRTLRSKVTAHNAQQTLGKESHD